MKILDSFLEERLKFLNVLKKNPNQGVVGRVAKLRTVGLDSRLSRKLGGRGSDRLCESGGGGVSEKKFRGGGGALIDGEGGLINREGRSSPSVLF